MLDLGCLLPGGDRGPSPWGGPTPDAPLVWRQPGAMCLGGDRRSPGLVPAGGAVFSLVRVTTNPQPPLIS